MPLRVGIDLVAIDDVREALRVHGARYVDRVYTEEEARRANGSALQLAGFFAVKEAAVKALGADVPPRSIEAGADGLRLSGAAAAAATSAGLDDWTMTIGRAGGYASAVVIARGAS